ncbi:MAG: polysaccharide pyruvyl transferase family protein [Clostridiales bacterium]|nr:polysaccharide pyruvyl transferase family protein [Clostridiales bacterium]
MKQKKKIIYAASTANADFTQENIESFSSLIRHPDFISCRETYGTELIHACGRKDAVTVLDPVLLLEAREYEKICAKRLIPEHYVLIYVPLGYDSRYESAAHAYAKEHSLAVVEISYYVWNNRKHKVMADVGIEEFLSLIKYADVVFTNSFHAVCFSCLFHKQFYAFERKTGRKTEDLCSRLGVDDHYMKIENFHERPQIDFFKVDKLLEGERKNSLSWLKKTLQD